MIVTVYKIKDGLWLKITNEIVEPCRLVENRKLVLNVCDGSIQLKPKRYELSELLDGINESNLHGETLSEGPIGNEIW